MQKLMGLVRRCVEDYHMIEPGDRIAVGVSGGKDSLLTLAALVLLLAGFASGCCVGRAYALSSNTESGSTGGADSTASQGTDVPSGGSRAAA